MRKLGKRVYKTTEGRLVLEGDPAAAFLAYSEHEEVPDEVADQFDDDRESKRVRQSANKARAKSEDK